MQLYTLPSNHSKHKHKHKHKFSSPWMAFRHRIRNYRRMGKLFAKTALKQCKCRQGTPQLPSVLQRQIRISADLNVCSDE